MTVTTINTFPSLHSWSSPRGWALAIIVLLHAGFFWALTNGLSQRIMTVFDPKPPVLIPDVEPQPAPERPLKPVDVEIQPTKVTYVEPETLVFQPDPVVSDRIYVPEATPPGSFAGPTGDVSPPEPVIVEPRADARRGLSEPLYPPQEIRQGHEGTVVLSLHILANGRVGDVRLAQSSGYPRLDESALREAKKWRFVPGTRDGVPFAMWKQMPVTFRLNK